MEAALRVHQEEVLCMRSRSAIRHCQLKEEWEM